MEQQPNYGRQHEPGDDVHGERETESSFRMEQDRHEETRYGEDSYGESRYEGSHYDSAGRLHAPAASLSPQDEKTWSMVSHLSVLLMLVFLPVGGLLVWLLYRDRSPRVRFHALQSLWYQLAWYGIWIVGGIVGAIFTFVTFGFGAIIVAPLAFILWLFPFAHGCYAAYKVSQGVDYRYPFIADKIDGGSRDY